MASAPTGDRAEGVDLAPPPAEPLFDRLTRWRLSQRRHNGLRYWFLTRGVMAAALYTGTFVLAGFTVGWDNAYDLSLGIISPTGCRDPLAAWPVSVAGWLVAPGLAGAVAGYLVSDSIARQRQRSIEELFPEQPR